MGRKSGVVGAAVLVLPVLEVVALIAVGNALGFFRTVALFVLLSIFGAWVFKTRLAMLAAQSFNTTAPSAGASTGLGSAVLAVVGGALIMLPGFVTAFLGGLLQLAPLRAALAHRVTGRFTTTVGSMGPRFGMSDPFSGRGDVIDVDLATQDHQKYQSSPELR